jgi:tRNA pseudouridine38/39 synthase
MVSGNQKTTIIKKNEAEIDYTKWTRSQLLDRIYQLEGRSIGSDIKEEEEKELKTIKQKNQKSFDFSKYQKRKIALKFAYLGWNYQGLALQGEETELPTVEEKIMEALYKVKLIGTLEQEDCSFSRCGRTDRGVSAMNQVISLIVRSKLTEEELKDPQNDSKEIDYIKALNQSLPDDIRVHSVCLRPPVDFDARFSCTFRYYKYIFNGEGLDIEAMNKAASYFLGDNDFRNFCKIDASKQITNFKRTILMSEIDKIPGEDNFYVFKLKGTAFLWHQVRCMVAVLLTVAQSLEEPKLIQELLDVKKYPSRPTYKMAHDVPLVLFDCGFNSDAVKWSTGPERTFNTNVIVNGLWNDYKIKSVVAGFMKSFTDVKFDDPSNKIHVNLGDGLGQAMKGYIKYEKRNRLETADQINAKWKGKKQNSRKREHSEIDL